MKMILNLKILKLSKLTIKNTWRYLPSLVPHLHTALVGFSIDLRIQDVFPWKLSWRRKWVSRQPLEQYQLPTFSMQSLLPSFISSLPEVGMCYSIYSCCNWIPRTGKFLKHKNFCLTILNAAISKLKGWKCVMVCV